MREAKGSRCHYRASVVSPKKGKFRLDILYIIFCNKGNEALAHVQRHGGRPVPGDTHGQAGQGSESLIKL